LVRFAGNGEHMSSAVAAAVRQTDATVLTDARTIQAWIDRLIENFWKMTILVMILGGVALALALTGIYGVVAFAVSRRARELGIRMALGARQPDIYRAVMLPGVKQIAGGVAVGMLLSAAAAPVLTRVIERSQLRVDARDPVAYAAVALLLTLAALIAMIAP